MTPLPEAPVTVLGTHEAWAELRRHRFGRLAIAFAGEPDIFPVNFAVDAESLVFLTAEGTKLLAASVEGMAAFEVDRVDASGATSVVVRGRLREVSDPAEREDASRLPLHPWVPTYKTHYLRLEAESVSGRTFAFGAERTEGEQDG